MKINKLSLLLGLIVTTTSAFTILPTQAVPAPWSRECTTQQKISPESSIIEVLDIRETIQGGVVHIWINAKVKSVIKSESDLKSNDNIVIKYRVGEYRFLRGLFPGESVILEPAEQPPYPYPRIGGNKNPSSIRKLRKREITQAFLKTLSSSSEKTRYTIAAGVNTFNSCSQ